jgi:hypothetical protein
VAGFRQIISGPEFTPLPNFLWDAAQHPSEAETGPHWQQGVSWIERCGGAGTLYDECIAVTGSGGGAVAAQGAMASNVTQTSRGATAFSVFAEFDCSPVGQDIQQDKAEEALSKMEAYQVTKAFWTGTAGYAGAPPGTPQTVVYPHLAAGSTLDDPQGIRLQTAASPIVTGTAGQDDPAVILGRLEAQLASCYGGQGVIHIPYAALPTFTSRMLILPESPNGLLRTLAGNLVVPGVGYTGTSPAGATPSEGMSYIYATGAVFGFRSDVYVREFPGTFDRAENTVRMIASRKYLFGFECCHIAALVQLGVPV